MKIKKKDSLLAKLILEEKKRQLQTLTLIPSENYTSNAVREALASWLTHKYAEGYPGKRYYQGNEIIDKIENLAIQRAKKLFDIPFANVQPYSGSLANMAVCFALTKPGETIMGMDFRAGGHLTHGAAVNFSGKFFKVVSYGVGKDGWLDYQEIEELAKKYKPKIIWCGATAYPRIFNWKKMGEIGQKVGAWVAADIAHYAGLIVGGVYPSPVSWTDVITTTTHKTLRGPRGAMILVTKRGIKKDKDLPAKINHWVFPGLQGGPHMNNIAGIAVSLKEAMRLDFKKYAIQIVKNAQVLAEELKNYGFELVTGGTDNHLILIDLRRQKIEGKEVAIWLEEAGVVVNVNSIPNDSAPPLRPSGIRLGTPAVTTLGMKEKEMKKIAEFIWRVATSKGEKKVITEVKKEVEKLTSRFNLNY